MIYQLLFFRFGWIRIIWHHLLNKDTKFYTSKTKAKKERETDITDANKDMHLTSTSLKVGGRHTVRDDTLQPQRQSGNQTSVLSTLRM